MPKQEIIEQLSQLYQEYGEGKCNSILETFVDETERESTQKGFSVIENSPLYIREYCEPLQVFGFTYNECTMSVESFMASNYHSAPPDTEEFYVDGLPDSILIFAIEIIKNNI